jgi:AraC-like DNA-binding protein
VSFALVRRGPEASAQRRIDARIRRALERVDESYGEALGVDELASEAGMSRSVFLRTFRAQVGDSPYRHLVRVRLDQAAHRLGGSHDSILDIATACGFGDPGRFARMFRARHGCTPREFRRRARVSPIG